jgi:hypothetical protein
VDAQNSASGYAQHDGAVVMGHDAGDIAKSEQMEPVTEEWVLLLTRVHHSP